MVLVIKKVRLAKASVGTSLPEPNGLRILINHGCVLRQEFKLIRDENITCNSGQPTTSKLGWPLALHYHMWRLRSATMTSTLTHTGWVKPCFFYICIL